MFDSGSSTGEISGHTKVVNAVSIRQQRPFKAATASDDTTIVFHTGVPFKFEKVRSIGMRSHDTNAQATAATDHQDAHQIRAGCKVLALRRSLRECRIRLKGLPLRWQDGRDDWRFYWRSAQG